MIALKMLIFLWICHCVLLQGPESKENSSVFLPSLAVSTGISKQMIPTKDFQNEKPDFPTTSYPTEERSAALTVVALSIIIFIVILVVIVIILVSVVSIKFNCHHCKKVTDKQKLQYSIVSYSCSDADTTVGNKNALLVSMKDLNATSSKTDRTSCRIICGSSTAASNLEKMHMVLRLAAVILLHAPKDVQDPMAQFCILKSIQGLRQTFLIIAI